MVTCPNCGFNSPDGNKYCGKCGTLIGTVCAKCGAANPLSYSFCGMCGAPLGAGTGEQGAQGALPAPGPAAAESQNVPFLPPPADRPPEFSLLEGERRVITVILADVYGSTNLLEQIGNEHWVDLMNRVLSMLEGEIYHFGGTVDQFRGDGLLAFFGAEAASEDDPERAVLAAMSMQERMAALTSELPASAPKIQLRVGVNTGEVIVAGIGTATQHREDTAMGIAITVAARMESSAEPGTVLVSENTYRQIASRFEWEALGETSIKGISHPIAVYRPLASNVAADRLSDLEVFGYAVNLVGRDQEFGELKQKLNNLDSGRGGIVLISGETGVGKNGLIRELRKYVLRKDSILADAGNYDPALAKQALWLSCRVKTYYNNAPYSVWNELANSWLGAYGGEDREQIRMRLRNESERLWGERIADYYPYLAKVMDLPLEDEFVEKVRYLDGEALRVQFQNSVRAYIGELAKSQPLILAISGMESSDPSSVEMINFCLSLVEEAPILWLLAYRPERSADMWNLRRTVEVTYPQYLLSIDLQPLTNEQCVELIQALVGPDTLPRALRDQIIANSEGMPAYIIEIFRALIENETLVQDAASGHWKLTRKVSSLDMPANLHRLLQARFDRLSDEERYVLQLAAVIGPVFWSQVLQQLLGEGEALREPLDALVHAQLIERIAIVPDLGVSYAFKSNMIRETAYDSLLSSQREWYHDRVAALLEEMADLQAREYQALIAFHYRNGHDIRKELFYTIWAGEKASEFFASAEAIEHYSRALEILNEMETDGTSESERKAMQTSRFEVLGGRYMEYYLLGEVDAGNKDAKALLDMARQSEDEPTWMIDALLRQPETALADQSAHLQPGLEMAEQALELARRLGDRHRQLLALETKARLQFIRGGLDAFESANQALILARELGDAESEVSLLLKLADGYGMDNVKLSMENLNRAVEINSTLKNKSLEIELLGALASVEERGGNYYAMLTKYEQKRLDLCCEIGDRLTEGFAMMYAAQVKGLYLGDYDTALGEMRKAFKLTKKVATSVYPMLRIVQLQAMMGNFEEAQSNLEQLAYPLGEKGSHELARVALRLNEAILCNQRGQEEDLRRACELTSFVKTQVEKAKVSWQYMMAACCEAAAAHLRLAKIQKSAEERQAHLQAALADSETAVRIFNDYGFVQISECGSEEILFRRGLALKVNQRGQEAEEFFSQAYAELMRKYELIPADSHYRQTFLENIALHREIRQAVEKEVKTRESI